MSFLKTLVDGNERDVARLRRTARAVNEFDAAFSALPDAELQAKTAEFKNRLEQGESLDAMLPEIFAVVREAGKRTLGMRHFDVQIMGGQVLFEGRIAEMKTGEGKTLVATLPVYARALEGRGVHVVTVNDYLARRDAEWMAPIYQYLGLSVGIIQHGLDPAERRAAYNCDVTYVTNNEVGFDYLRDNMAWQVEDLVQRELYFALVDEVDSILVDEARTPLIISGPSQEATELYEKFAQIIPRLKKGEDYTVDEKAHAVPITEAGVARVEKMLGIQNLVRAAQHRADASAQRRAQGLESLPSRPAVHRKRWRSRHRRRVHRTADVRPALLRRHPSSDRSEGRHQSSRRGSDARDDHLPKSFPALRSSRRHDRYGKDRGARVSRHLRIRRRRRADEHADGSQR